MEDTGASVFVCKDLPGQHHREGKPIDVDLQTVHSSSGSASTRTKRPWRLSSRLRATVRLLLMAITNSFPSSVLMKAMFSLDENQLSVSTWR